MNWFVAFVITAGLLLASMLLSARIMLTNHKMMEVLQKMRKALAESNETSLRLTKELGEETLKSIERMLKHDS